MLIDTLWEEYDRIISSLLDKANGMKIIIWGGDINARALVHAFSRKNRSVEFIISKSGERRYNDWILRERKDILDLLNIGQYIIMNTSWREEEIEIEAGEYGYSVEKGNLVHTRKFFSDKRVDNIEYSNYIESKTGIDLTKIVCTEVLGYTDTNKIYFGAAFSYTVEKTLDLFQFHPQDKVIDLGCGKGGILPVFQKSGIKQGTGLEYDSRLARIAEHNLSILGMVGFNIINCGAESYTELDEYNYFYLFNPFIGDIFGRVIDNIEESLKRCRRKAFLIYINPLCHRRVLQNNIFKLINCVDSEQDIKRVHVYANQ